MRERSLAAADRSASAPLIINPELCTGCNQCVEVCQVDLMLPNPLQGGPPIVQYPDECWYGGCCVAVCPIPGAIRLIHPPMNRVYWKPKESRS